MGAVAHEDAGVEMLQTQMDVTTDTMIEALGRHTV